MPSHAAAAVDDAQLVLERPHREVPLGLTDLRDRGVAEAEVLDLPLLLQLGERREALLERGLRVVSVQEEHEEPLHAEGREAPLHHSAQMIAAAVRDPAALRAREPGLGDHADLVARALPGRERLADQALAVVQIAVVGRVGVRGVEDPDALLQGEAHDLDRLGFGGAPLGR